MPRVCCRQGVEGVYYEECFWEAGLARRYAQLLGNKLCSHSVMMKLVRRFWSWEATGWDSER